MDWAVIRRVLVECIVNPILVVIGKTRSQVTGLNQRSIYGYTQAAAQRHMIPE
jgi:hypothetical protein